MEQTLISTGYQSKSLYRIAGTLALLIVAAGIIDAVTSNMGAGAQSNTSILIKDWFELFQSDPFSAFSALGVINIFTLSMSIPIYLAFHQAHRADQPVLAALVSILFSMGVAVYISSNSVFSLFALSRQYAVAAETQKPLLEAAGNALLAQGADLTSGTLFGLLLTQVAGILITGNMLRGKLFGKWIGLAGLAGFSLTTAFFILSAFAPARYEVAMLFAMPGGLILMAYEIMLARRLFQLGK